MPETDDTAARARVSPVALAVLAAVAAVVYAFDRITKHLVVDNLTLGESVPFLGEVLKLRYVENPGAAFSLGSGTTWIFAIIATGVAVFIVAFARRIKSRAWAVLFGMLLGGTLGNLTDRLTREPGFGQGHVVDFLELWMFPAIFNIADVAIVASMGLFIILTLRGTGLDGTRASRKPDPEAAQPEPAPDAE